jgi:MerR family transcriptional regulator, redox-sensitive transcriptional activator SoxR
MIMKIGELARRAGIRPSAIRFYERAGLLPPPARRGGQRLFTSEAERYLAVIGAARAVGFTIAEVKAVFHGFRESTPASVRWRRLALAKSAAIDLQIRRLRAMQRLLQNGARCRCIQLEDCGRIIMARRETSSSKASRASSTERGFPRRNRIDRRAAAV